MSKIRSYFWWQNRVAVRIIGPIHERIRRPFSEGKFVAEGDWDNLILFDACRVDLFEEVIDLNQFDSYRTVKSLGSTSGQWYERNFSDDVFGDTVLVTANPHAAIEAPDRFYEMAEIDRRGIDVAGEEIFGFHPEDVQQAAIAARERHDDKRIIVHFMQPHIPFIADPGLVYKRYRDENSHTFGGRKDPIHVFEAFAHGLVDFSRFWKGYRENFEFVLGYGLDLAHELEGRTVFTSDHGNMLGERTWPIPIRLYGHPRGVRTRELVDVPWAVLEIGERRRVVEEQPQSDTDLDSNQIEQRLADLGYVEH